MFKFFLFVLIITLLITSCAVYKPSTTIHMIDFREYSQKGFLITPYSYTSEKYESLGLIYGYFTPGFEEQEGTIIYQPTAKEAARGIKPKYSYDTKGKNFNLTAMVDQLYLKALAIGGDAIVDFKWEIVPNKDNASSLDIEWEYTVIMEGFVIKRK